VLKANHYNDDSLVHEKLSALHAEDSHDLQTFENFMFSSLGVDASSPLYAPLIYSLEHGKRTRALLTIKICRHYKIPDGSALPLATAIEMVHAFSLIQDDLPCMDNDPQRRNKPSLHIKFDISTALLTANCLFSKAFELLSSAAQTTNSAQITNQCIAELSDITGSSGMSLGQWLDLHASFSAKKELLESYALKSGLLFAACLALPAILAGQNPNTVKKLKEIGRHIGTIYQIKDDLDDYAEKPTLKNTLPDTSILHLLERPKAKALKNEMTKNLLSQLKQLDEIGEIINLNITSIIRN